MFTSKAFEIAECQVVLYTPGLRFSANRVLSAILTKWGSLYDGEPVALPSSDQLPQEVPRVILSSRDGQHRLQASDTRLDVFRRALPEQSGLRLGEMFRDCSPILDEYVRATSAVVNRLAVVVKRIANADEPAKELARHFCKDEWLRGPLNRPQQFELHAHKVFRMPGSVSVNSWFRCKTAILSQPDERPGILVEQDFNTLISEEHEYSADEREKFFLSTIPALDEVLELYFPTGAPICAGRSE